jgi:hypothetical protein
MGGATVPTVKEPLSVKACGSQTNLYVPVVRFSVQIG